MKKHLIIIAVTILLIILGFSGCFENNNKDNKNGQNSENNLFIGTWKTTPYSIVNGTRNDSLSSTATFYSNGTMRSESVYDVEIMWTPYIIENNQICFGEANDSDYLCYTYEFSNDNNTATLEASIQNEDTGDTYEFFVELIKI